MVAMVDCECLICETCFVDNYTFALTQNAASLHSLACPCCKKPELKDMENANLLWFLQTKVRV